VPGTFAVLQFDDDRPFLRARLDFAGAASAVPSRPEPRLEALGQEIEDIGSCVDGEAALDSVFDPRSSDVVRLTSGKDPVFTRDRADDPALPITDSAEVEWFRQRAKEGLRSVFVGYPTITGAVLEDGKEQVRIAPLYTAECEFREEGTGIVLERVDPAREELNAFALRLLLPDDRELTEELEQILGRSALVAEAKSVRDRLQTRVNVLQTEGVLAVVPAIEPNQLGPLATARGLANVVMIVPTSVRSGFTRQLIADLEQLASRPPEQLEQGPLGMLLGGKSAPVQSTAEAFPTLLASNYQQHLAVTSALEQMLTVVTGPPGTGKSQTLVNAIAAAVTRGQSVLFASKNNQAVDVVCLRLEKVAIGAHPIRTGNRKYREAAASRLKAAMAPSGAPTIGLATAIGAWEEVAKGVRPLHQSYEKRVALERELAQLNEQLRTALTGLAPRLHLEIEGPSASRLGDAVRESRNRRPGFFTRLVSAWSRKWEDQERERLLAQMKLCVPPTVFSVILGPEEAEQLFSRGDSLPAERFVAATDRILEEFAQLAKYRKLLASAEQVSARRGAVQPATPSDR
jgi:hypothetical protein